MENYATAERGFSQNVLSRLKTVLKDQVRPIALHEPRFSGNEWAYVKECLDSSWVSSVGSFVTRFENELCEITGAKYAIAVVNGTAALHIALKLAGVVAGDEVMIPALTFVAAANAVSYCNAVPHFVDINERTLGICPKSLQQYLDRIAIVENGVCLNRDTRRPIRALMPMHTFGHAVDLDALVEIAERYGLIIVEDCAEALGSSYKQRHLGVTGLVSALSFNGNKIVTTGGGGAILTNDSKLAGLARHLTTTAKVSHPWNFDHDMVGYNYRLPNINAALGCAQLESLATNLVSKRKLFVEYAQIFADLPGVTLFEETIDCKSNYWLQALILNPSHAHYLEELLRLTNDAGIMTRPVWTPMHQLSHFSMHPRAPLPNTESIASRLLNIPSSAHLIGEK